MNKVAVSKEIGDGIVALCCPRCLDKRNGDYLHHSPPRSVRTVQGAAEVPEKEMTLEDLAKLVEAGTPGPFHQDGPIVVDSRGFDVNFGRADAAWIAAVRNHLPRLVRELRKATRVRPPLAPLNLTDDRTIEQKAADGDHPNPYIKCEPTAQEMEFQATRRTLASQIERAVAIPAMPLKPTRDKAVECPWYGCSGVVQPGVTTCPSCGKGVSE